MVRQLPDFFELYLINVTVGKSNLQALKDAVKVIEGGNPLVARHIAFYCVIERMSFEHGMIFPLPKGQIRANDAGRSICFAYPIK